jgi:inorganic phosphate transporter, PiT family
MTTLSSTGIASAPSESPKPKLDQPMGVRTILIFLAIMALGLFFAAYNIYKDISAATTVRQHLAFASAWRRSADRAWL